MADNAVIISIIIPPIYLWTLAEKTGFLLGTDVAEKELKKGVIARRAMVLYFEKVLWL
jgi:hypothetical protein